MSFKESIFGRKGDITNPTRQIYLLGALAVAVICAATLLFSSPEDRAELSDAFDKAFGKRAGYTVVSDGDLAVYAIDVGQGDCLLVRGGGADILIDAGEQGKGDEVVAFLKSLGVERLDWAVCTHPHSDHLGGMDTVIYDIGADNVLMPDIPDELLPNESFYRELTAAIDSERVSVTYAEAHDCFTFGDMTMTVLWPREGFFADDMNDWSVALRFVCGDAEVLACGDISGDIERELAAGDSPLFADIFKCSHHGSVYSNTEEFLDEIKPRYALISCGSGNDYGHPGTRTLERLKSAGAEYLRTDLDGTIGILYTDGSYEIKLYN